MLTLADIDFLASDVGAQHLAQLAEAELSEAHTLNRLQKLRQHLTQEQAAAVLTMARLRQKALAKFGADAQRLFFLPDALEQASDPQVRAYRAHISGVAGQRVMDAGCSIGADALAFASAGADVLGLDRDPVRIAVARHNAAALGLSARFEVADIRASLPEADLIFFDPARRDAQGRRIHDVEAYQPPLATVLAWNAPRCLVKLSPGVDLAQLTPYSGRVEFISVSGELKEALLWLDGVPAGPSATLLDDEAVHHWPAMAEPESAVSAPRQWLIEPDPALLRAGLVRAFAASVGAYLLDVSIAYLTADAPPVTPWARAWRIRDWMPYHLKRLRAYLREHDVGRVTVKKRGSPITPQALQKQLKLKGGQGRQEAATLVLTRHAGRPIVLICDEHPTNRRLKT